MYKNDNNKSLDTHNVGLKRHLTLGKIQQQQQRLIT